MAPNSHRYRCSYQVAYEADSNAPLDRDVLACVRFGDRIPASPDPRHVNVALPQTGDLALAEVWRSHRPVEHGWTDGFGFAHNGEVLFGTLRLKEREISDLKRATTRVYVRIERLLRQLGYPCWLRVWNLLGQINHGEGDAERYRQFNEGRYCAVALKPGFEAKLPAASAIGTQDDGLTVYFLAAREHGEQVENPRQVSAFHYPAAYGRNSPSFSRATLKHWADGVHLFVSGTASVVGHESLHPGDALAQIDETWRNFEALLQQAALLHPLAGPFRAAALKMFIRRDQHAPALLVRAHQLFGEDVPLIGVTGDICRRDLLVEIEGLYTAAPRKAFLQAAA